MTYFYLYAVTGAAVFLSALAAAFSAITLWAVSKRFSEPKDREADNWREAFAAHAGDPIVEVKSESKHSLIEENAE